VGPDNEVLTMFVLPKRNVYGEWANEQARPLFLLVALIVSAAVSYALASAISRPVRKFREATVAIAEGDLGTRVADSVGRRRDEIGMLARDIDSMSDKLELAARQQTELTRNISHELRSPLARMRVALELARRQAGDLAEFSRIESETERLDDLIGQILSYSRMQARNDETPASLDLAELVQEVVENVNFECRSTGIDGVSVEFTQEARPVVSGFGPPLTSAVENVLRNAVRHSPRGGLVSVRLFRDDGNAVLRIRDQGPGVAEDELDSLFEPFYRTRESVQRDASQGTGLGLAIARRAVQKSGGSIEARNAGDGGLCIDITLPVDDASA
jgi:two-component system OmpR family sensor kinase